MTSATLLGHYDPGSSEWHAARHYRLGASEIAAVMGLSPWESPFSIFHRKAGSIASLIETEQMSWGKDMEGVIARWYQRAHPEIIVQPCGLYVNSERDYQVAQPDREICPETICTDETIHSLLEIKTARLEERWGKPGTDDIPVYYKCQCLWQLDCLGLDVCHVATSISGAPPVEYVVTRSDNGAHEGILLMREAAEKFIESLRTGDAPDLDGHDATYRAVRELHPDVEPRSVEVSADIALPYIAAIASMRTTEAEKRRCSAEVVDAIGNAQYATFLGDRIASRQARTAEGSIPYLVAARSAAGRHKGVM